MEKKENIGRNRMLKEVEEGASRSSRRRWKKKKQVGVVEGGG